MRLADAIGADTTLVAFSLVQSSTGEVAPVDDIVAAARGHEALICVDASQACGWLPVRAASFDVLVCAAYKWRRGRDVHDSYYGPPLRLAGSARRFGTSPAWFSFVGAAERLAAAGVRAAVRAGRARLSLHLYTTDADVDRALEALTSR